MAIFPALRIAAGKARHLRALPALLLGIALLTACHKPAVTDPNDPNFIVADNGSWTITRGELNAEVDSYLKQKHATRDMVGAANLPYVDTGVLRRMVLKKLLLDKAATMQLKDVDKDIAAQIDAVKQSIPPGTDFDTALKAAGMTLDELKQRVHDAVVVQKVVEAEAFKDVQPTEQEIDEVYNSHKDAFQVPPTVRASRVLILVGDKDTDLEKAKKEKAIKAARERVMKGEAFSQVAEDVSQDQSSRTHGGDMGKFPRGTNEPGFDDYAFNTKVGVVSPVFQDGLGWQFIKVTDKEPAGTVPLADARAIIAPQLLEAKKNQKASEYAHNLLTTSNVTFHITMADPPAQMSQPGGPGGPGAPPPGEPSAPPPDASAPAPSSGGAAPNGNLPAPDLSATNSPPSQ
jgi:parvulin-like peptidyl-prolyl isomerase